MIQSTMNTINVLTEHVNFCSDNCRKRSKSVQCPTVISSSANAGILSKYSASYINLEVPTPHTKHSIRDDTYDSTREPLVLIKAWQYN